MIERFLQLKDIFIQFYQNDQYLDIITYEKFNILNDIMNIYD